MTQDLQTTDLPAISDLDRPMSSGDLTRQALLIQEILDKVMVVDIHYGVIPGTGNKKTLYQSGAEKLCSTFHLAPKYAVEDLSEPHNNFYRYRVACSLYTIRDGNFVGSACGEATSAEEKYQWERAVCQEHWDATDPSRRRVKYKKEGDGFSTINQVQRNAADLSNTVLKIACKRALISATRGATAASDMLEVDLDEEAVADLAKEQRADQPQAKPKAKEQPAPTIPYGKWKVDENGQPRKITDLAIPTEYLQWMADKTAAQLQDPAREKFRASDTLFVAALDGEIAKRKASQPKPAEEPSKTPQNPSQAGPSDVKTPTQGDKPSQGEEPARKPFTEKGWAEFVLYAEEEAPAEYADVKKTFKVASGHDLPKEKRITFFDMLNGLVEANKK